MKSGRLHLLIVDDEEAHVEAIQRAFAEHGMETDIRVAGTLSEYRNCIAADPPDIALIDLNLPDGRAGDILTLPAEDGPFPILVMTAFGNQQIVVDIMKAGAMDYVVKSPAAFTLMPRTVERVLREWKLLQSHKKADELLLRSEAHFRQLFQEMPIPLCFGGKDQVVMEVNKCFTKVFGYSRDDVPDAESWFQRAYPDEVYRQEVIKKWDAFMQAAARAESDIEPSEYRVTCKNGDVRVMLISGHAIGEDFLFIFIDLTERKRAEEATRENEMLLRESQEIASLGSYVLDIATGIWTSSPVLDKVFGIDRNYVRTVEGWLALIHPDDRAMMENHFKNEVIGLGWPFNKEYRLIRQDNQAECWVHGLGKLEYDGQGRLVSMHGTIQDITERKENERQFRQLSRAVEQSPVAIVITDINGHIEYVNPKFSAITGYSLEEIIGQNPRILKSGETPPEAYKALWDTITAGCEWRGEFHNRKKNGELFWERASISPITDKKGVITNFLAVKEDITEHKRLEEQFLRAQRIENIGRLASGVVHDLNNILSPIMMAASMMDDDLPSEVRQNLVVSIQEAARRGADIVKQVLTFARGVEGQKITLRPQLLVAQVENILRETFPKSITFTTSIPKDLWGVVGDMTQLHQVLLNLCVNARDAMMPGGGTLFISADNIEIDENYAVMANDAKPGRYVVMKVIDSGSGIPPAIIDKIFDPFFTTKEVGKGTGLGLSTIVGIVRSHGGFLEVESQEGKGSVFRVFIPAALENQPAASPEDSAVQPKGNGETILIVDDEPGILKVATTVLTKAGYIVTTASDGVEALTAYVKNPGQISVVVTDVMMPMMGGVNLTRALKKINPDVRIVATSGHTEEANQNELSALGVCVFLKKPFTNRQLTQTVHDAMESAET